MNATVTNAPPVSNPTGNPAQTTQTNATPDGKPVVANDKQNVVENPFKGSKHKVKIDGKEMDVDYDELLSGYQLRNASLSKMNEAAKQQQMAQEVLKQFSSKDKAAFEKLGIDPYEWAEQMLSEKIQRDLMTPEQREKNELLSKIAAYEQEKKAAEESSKQAEFQKAYNFHAQDLDKKFTEALKNAKVPKTTATVRRMADYMLRMANAGQNVDPLDVVQYVKQDYMEEHQQLWGESDLDQLYEQFGKANIDKLIKAHNSKMSKADPTPSRPRTNGSKPAGKVKKGPKDLGNTFKAIRDRYS